MVNENLTVTTSDASINALLISTTASAPLYSIAPSISIAPSFSGTDNNVPYSSSSSSNASAFSSSLNQNRQHELKVNPFYPNDPSLWFKTTELLFSTYGVNTQKSKLACLIQSLDMDQVTKIQTVIDRVNQIPDPYEQAKNLLLSSYGDTDAKRLQKLLNSSPPTDQHKKPSEVLQYLRNLAGPGFSENMIKEIWLSRIAPDVRLGVATVQPLVNLNDLAKIADDVYDLVDNVARRNGACEVAAVSNTGFDQQLLMRTVQALSALQHEMTKINGQLSSLISLQQERNSRSPERNRGKFKHRQQRQRSASPMHAQPFVNGICAFHAKYKERAYKCVPGCQYTSKNE